MIIYYKYLVLRCCGNQLEGKEISRNRGSGIRVSDRRESEVGGGETRRGWRLNCSLHHQPMIMTVMMCSPSPGTESGGVLFPRRDSWERRTGGSGHRQRHTRPPSSGIRHPDSARSPHFSPFVSQNNYLSCRLITLQARAGAPANGLCCPSCGECVPACCCCRGTRSPCK